MKSLTEYQLRHLAVVTNRLAAMDGRALFRAMQDRRRLRRLSRSVAASYWGSMDSLRRYAGSAEMIRAELARRGPS